MCVGPSALMPFVAWPWPHAGIGRSEQGGCLQDCRWPVLGTRARDVYAGGWPVTRRGVLSCCSGDHCAEESQRRQCRCTRRPASHHRVCCQDQGPCAQDSNGCHELGGLCSTTSLCVSSALTVVLCVRARASPPQTYGFDVDAVCKELRRLCATRYHCCGRDWLHRHITWCACGVAFAQCHCWCQRFRGCECNAASTPPRAWLPVANTCLRVRGVAHHPVACRWKSLFTETLQTACRNTSSAR
jgi:hypothetical protein